jgi:hypothetical protein
LRTPAIALAVAYAVAIVLLGPLLGSTADASTAYEKHFDDDGNVVRDLLGSLALVIAAAMLAWTAIAARASAAPKRGSSARDLVAAAGLVSASAIIAAAGLLATVPVATRIGDLTDDPGIDVTVEAGIAQAGSVMLFVAVLPLAAMAVLLARLGRQQGALPRWISITAWIVAAGLLLGVSVGLLLPFAAWAVALALTWKSDAVEGQHLDGVAS